MGRRGENIRRRADGRWEARVVQGRPIGGKTNYKYFYGRTYQEVRQKKKQFLADWQPGAPGSAGPASNANGEQLFQYIISDWLISKKAVVKPSTLACYTTLAEKHLLPEFGVLPLRELHSARLSEFLERQKAHGRVKGGPLSDKTVSDIKVVLMQILHFAKQQGLLAAVPECHSVARRPQDISVLTLQEQKRVEDQVLEEDTPFSLGILLSLYGGLRIGEVCGLRWGDFDWANGTVTISRTIYRLTAADGAEAPKTKVVIGTPKTDRSARTIPPPAPVLLYFMQRRCAGDCYIATGTTKYMEPRVCLDRYKRLLRRAGVADHTFHALRHTFATRCIECGVDVKSLSEIMGHADVRITLQRYVHPSMDTKKAQVNKLLCFDASGQKSGQVYGQSA